VKKIVRVFKERFGQIQSLEFIKNGKELLTCSDITKRNSLDRAILVWDWESSCVLSNQVYQEGYTITCVKEHPSSKFFLAQSNAGYIAIFSTKKPYKLNKRKRFEGHKVSGYHLGFDMTNDGKYVISGSSTGEVFIYNWNTGNITKRWNAHSKICSDISCHPNSSLIATSSWDKTIKIWNLTST